MKTPASLAALTAAFLIIGCEHSSRLDNVTSKDKVAAAPSNDAPAGAPPGPGKIDRTGTVEEQLKRLQDAYDRNAEATAFLNKVYAQQKAQQAAQEHDEPAEDARFAVNVSDDIKAGQVDGPADAPVTIIKAFDFACPFCQRVSGTMEELVKDYKGKVRVVYANLVVHEPARPAHLASCAAAKQGKYKEFKDAFWDKGFLPYAQSPAHDPATLGEANILTIAKDLGLDTGKLKTDMNSPECAKRIETDMNEMAKFHVNSTPTFFINGKFINGALPKQAFQTIIDEQLKVAEASGVSGADYFDKVVMAKGEKQFRSKADPKPH
jgi:protein-disulfide isomerase